MSVTPKKTYFGFVSYFYSVWIPYFEPRMESNEVGVQFAGALSRHAAQLALIRCVCDDCSGRLSDHEFLFAKGLSPWYLRDLGSLSWPANLPGHRVYQNLRRG